LTAALTDRYRIERELGQGGMATVYLAEDLKHKRKVALKVLKPELAAVLGAERFVQEITTTAALQHPHILPLFDSGTADGFLYYVMPFIDGETLRARLDRETQLGVGEAVRITAAVADALDYAHRRGVIHRDIKPENILLHEGRPMVADFGIALAVSAAAGGRMTETGLSLGTPHYMSPEQATAEKEISARSDVYSLASVLYEMLAGQPPHLGGSAQQIIMRIVTDTARPVTELRKAVPPNVAAAVAKALEKLPADRFESAKDFGRALTDPAYASQDVAGLASIRTRYPAGSSMQRWSLLGWAAGVIGVALAAWSLMGARGESRANATVKHLSIVLPDTAPLVFVGASTLGGGWRGLAITPDGRTLVYPARVNGVDQLYRRDIANFTTAPIPGTAGASSPFLSPNGEWIGFFSGPELRKIPLTGGTAVTLAAVSEAAGATWAPDGRILVSAREGSLFGWVPEGGGPIQPIPNPQGIGRTQPSLLPDGKHALIETWGYSLLNVIAVVNLESGRTMTLTVDGPVVADSARDVTSLHGTQPQFLSSGHLLFVTPTGIRAVSFDADRWTLEGRPVEILSGVRQDFGAQFVVDREGTLVYAPGADGNVGAFAWAGRNGSVDSVGFPAQRYGPFDLSPDGRRVTATVIPSGGTMELWVYDLENMTHTTMPTRGIPYLPRWWPDGRRIVFTETSPDPPYRRIVVRQLVESAGQRDTLAEDWEFNDFASDTLQAVGVRRFGRGSWIVPLQKGTEAIALDTFPNAWGPTYSRDGRWIAYTSNESGQYEIYVTEANRRGERRKISRSGGEEPRWTRTGDELIYRWGQEWFSVAAPPPGSSAFAQARMIFRGPYVNVADRSHDISPDGRRHLVILGQLAETTTRLNVITNWLDDVRRKVARP